MQRKYQIKCQSMHDHFLKSVCVSIAAQAVLVNRLTSTATFCHSVCPSFSLSLSLTLSMSALNGNERSFCRFQTFLLLLLRVQHDFNCRYLLLLHQQCEPPNWVTQLTRFRLFSSLHVFASREGNKTGYFFFKIRSLSSSSKEFNKQVYNVCSCKYYLGQVEGQENRLPF